MSQKWPVFHGLLFPTLSTIKQPGFDMGKKAAQVLIMEIESLHNNTPFTYQNIVLPTELIIRNST